MVIASCLAFGNVPSMVYAEEAVTAVEVTTQESAPAEPEGTPAEPEAVPVEPEEMPAEPESEPAEPEGTPSEPESVPTESTAEPAEPESMPAEPGTVPAEPEEAPTEPTAAPTELENTPESGETESETREWKDQSNGVDTTLGDPDQTDHGPIENLPEEYEDYRILVDPETGVYKLTYTIKEGVSEENLTIDLTKALEALQKYAAITESDWMLPGDSRVFEIYIETESKHTYKYKDGSFTLQTPEMKPEEGLGDGGKDPVNGFDGQELEDGYILKDTELELSAATEPIKELFKKTGVETDDFEMNRPSGYVLDKDQQKILKEYFLEKFGTDDIQKGMDAYLLAYYQEKDGVSYKDFNEMLSKSPNAGKELLGTQSNNGHLQMAGDSQKVYIKNSKNQSFNVNYKKITELLEAAGVATDTKEPSYSQLMKYLDENYAANGDMNAGITNYLLDYYSKADGTVYTSIDEIYSRAKKDFGSDRTSTQLWPKDPDVSLIEQIDPATRYNNFYQNLINFVYGQKEDIDQATGGMTGVQTETKFYYDGVPTYDSDGNVSTVNGLVPAKNASEDWRWIIEDILGLPGDTLIDPNADPYSMKYFLNEKGEVITASNSAAYRKEVTTTQAEYENDSWTSENGMKNQIAEYMKKADAECWKKANEFFNELMKEGISADDAAGISFMMAFNYDGELMGNINQNTDWGWQNTIDLERIDGEFELTKVDENGNVIGDDEGEGETSFYLWYTEKENDRDVYYYYTYIPEDGSYGFAKYDEKQNEMDFTIQTVDGKLDIDFEMLETVVYYLQEAAAPDGYEVDTNIYIIANEEQYEALLNGNATIINAATGGTFTVQDDCVVWQGSGINSEKTLEIKFVNKKTATPPDPTDPVDPVDPTPPDPTDPETPEIPETPVPVPVAEDGIIILDEEVPMGAGPELIDILDEDVPLGRLPQTGQSWNMIWLLTAAGVLMLLVGMTKKCGENK